MKDFRYDTSMIVGPLLLFLQSLPFIVLDTKN